MKRTKNERIGLGSGRIFRFAAALLALLLCLCACGSNLKTGGSRLYAVATNFAVYDILRSVAGDTADVDMLLPPETESHGYEITLADAAKIARADLFVCVGGESEDWVFDTLDAMAPDDRPPVLYAMEVCAALEESSDAVLEKEEDEDEQDAQPETDEHVWTSFGNIRRIAQAISDALNRVDEWGASERADNMIRYFSELNALEAEYAALFASTDRRLVAVADRFPFRYLAEEWELDCVAAFSGCSSNVEASLSTVNALVETVRKNGLPCVFKIELSDGRCADAVARETGCAVLTLQSGHNVTKEQFAAGVRLTDLMRENLDALRTALE